MKVLDTIKIRRTKFNCFEELVNIALTAHCLPGSNAADLGWQTSFTEGVTNGILP